MRIAILAIVAASLAAMCTPGQPAPAPEPTVVIDPAPPPTVSTACLMAYQHMADIECPPEEATPRAWVTTVCPALPEATVNYVITTNSCLDSRACLESEK